MFRHVTLFYLPGKETPYRSLKPKTKIQKNKRDKLVSVWNEWNDARNENIDNVINFKQLNIELGKLKLNNIKLFIEPGRFIVAESGIIWGKVNQIKYKNNTKFIGTNVGMTDIIRPALYSAIHPIFFKDSDNNELATVVGPICESGDVLIKNINVSKDIQIGDSLIVTNTGAYGFVMASQYNNRCLPVEIII